MVFRLPFNFRTQSGHCNTEYLDVHCSFFSIFAAPSTTNKLQSVGSHFNYLLDSFSDFGAENFQLDQNALKKFSFAKVVLKESLRMFPVSVGVGRVLPDQAVFSGYQVPPGTIIVTQNQVSCRLPQFCPNPNQYLPERWIKGHKGTKGFQNDVIHLR
jgi:hypothetical protein